MILKDKSVLVVGLAVTGVPVVKMLAQLGARVIVNDIKSEEELKESIQELQGLEGIMYILGKHPEKIEELQPIDLVVVSPGVPLEIPFIQLLKAKHIPIIGEIELAYRFTKASIVAITGTNGKTTTTALTGEIFKNANRNTYVVGNIGVAAISKALETTEEDVMVMEVSSFQLESVVDFHPKVGAILNLTPDHLNRHKTMERYGEAKFNLFKNQTSEDYAVINYDDERVRGYAKNLIAKKIYFSRKEKLPEGVFVEEGEIVIQINGSKHRVVQTKDIKIPGLHNLENALAATAMAYVMGVDVKTIGETLMTFGGVAHRIEFVDEIEGVKFINDSKATNTDAAIKALEAVEAPIILLAGGMDKGSDFTDFFDAFNGKVKYMLVYGETASILYETALSMNFTKVEKVRDLEEAVVVAYKIAKEGDTVLLSPACASWDMYKNFEERGLHFKRLVANVRRS